MFTRVLLVATATVFSANANALITQELDSFTEGPQVVQLPGGPATDTVALPGNPLIDTRTLTLSGLVGVGNSTAEVLTTSPGVLTFSNDALTQADLQIDWGLPTLDFTKWDEIRLTFLTLDQGNLDLELVLFDTNGLKALANTALVISPTVFGVTQSDFQASADPGFNPAQIVQMTLLVDTLNDASDLTLDDISLVRREQVPSPGPLSLLGASLVGLGMVRRNKRS